MKRLLKIAGALVLTLVVGIASLMAYVKIVLPDVGEAPDVRVELTPERIEHGRYLAHSVTVCMDCHSTRDWSKFSGPVIPGTEGKGGERFDQSMGFPGIFFSSALFLTLPILPSLWG